MELVFHMANVNSTKYGKQWSVSLLYGGAIIYNGMARQTKKKISAIIMNKTKLRTERQLRFNASNFFPGLVSLLAFAWLFVFTLVVADMFFFVRIKFNTR